MNYVLYVYFYEFNAKFAQYYLDLVHKKLSNEKNIHFEIDGKISGESSINPSQISSTSSSSQRYILKCNCENSLKTCISYLLYSTHPFHTITDEDDTPIISSTFKYSTSFKYYNLYNSSEHKENLFLYLEQLFQTHLYLKSILENNNNNNMDKSTKELKKISFVNPYATSNSQVIETSLFYQTHHYNIGLRNQIQYNNSKISIPMIQENFNIFKQDLLEHIPAHSKFLTSNHVVVLSDLNFKQLKEEGLKAGVKMKVSIFDFDFLDVKFIKDQFDVCISSFLTIHTKSEFQELISQYLYQGEFISSKCISILTYFEIPSTYLRKYKLKVVKKKRVNHNSKEILLYILTRK